MNQSTTRRTFLRATGVTTLLAGTSPLLAWEQVCKTHNLTNTAFTTLKNQLTAGSPAGKLILPGDSDYATARLSQHINFNGVFPVGIAQCATSDHVKHCIDFAKQHGLELVIRGGGHSYEGYCVTGGLILDVSLMKDIQVNPTTKIATVGAGCNLWELYNDLANLTPQLSFPGGTCPTVGVSGFLLGGGMGFQDRTYGMGCDRVVEVTVVTADGDVLTADKDQHSDLFWACCGGGGGNFGVVTQFKLQCHPMSYVQWKAASWPIANSGSDPTDDEPDVSHAVTVFQAYVAWLNTEQVAGVTDLSGEDNPSGGKSSMMNTAFEIKSGYWWPGHPGPGQCLLTMQYYDENNQGGTSTAAVDTALAGLVEMIKQKDPTISAPDLAHPPYPLPENPKNATIMETYQYNAACNSPHGCDDPKPQALKGKSTYFASNSSILDPDSPALTQAIQKVWQNLSNSKYKLPQSGGYENAMLQFKPGGGKIQFNEDGSPVATDMNAFVHRDWLLHCQYLVYWGTNEHVSTPPFTGFPDCADRGKRMDWINDTYAILNPAGNNEAYQNYIDRDLPNWLDAYYGSNLNTLKTAKKTYDPDNFWKFAQSIPPA